MRVSTRRLQLSEEDRRFEVDLTRILEDGGWEDVFGEPGPISLEIGLGKDLHLAEAAERHPDQRCVGLEISRKKLDMVLKKLGRRGGPDNVRVLHADVTRVIDAAFAPASLECVSIFFPDPWPKARHEGRRLIAPQFIARLVTRMAPGAVLEVRTDNVEYREQIAETLEAEPSLENLVETGTHPPYRTEPFDPLNHVPTLFERKFIEQGLPIHYFAYERRGEGGN